MAFPIIRTMISIIFYAQTSPVTYIFAYVNKE
ncbi:hypothetical protein MSKU15_1958 [Komagataeibacter diospyri]|nr:hypothetical protein MSKU15_1958 [Komagataeibacter diospyri]